MLKRQGSDINPMSFLAGNSEMAKRIREFDWTGHPIGPPETWPQSMKSALGICLNSAFPTAIYWGSELRLLYNDAWAPIPGPRHPDCLGEPAKKVWSDIWHVIEPQFANVIETGEGLFLDDQFLPMRRYGFEEETYWSYNFTPIRGADGAIEGIFNSGQETTAKVNKQRQTAFLLNLIEALRSCKDAEEIMQTSCRMLGGHLNASRVSIHEVEPGVAQFRAMVEWAADGSDQTGSAFSWTHLGSTAQSLREGRVVRIGSIEELGDDAAKAVRLAGAASILAVPWHRSGELAAVLLVHRAAAQPWSDEVVATADRVLARVIQAVDEERANEREKTMVREIDHRARNMLGVSQALIRMVRADDVETFRTSILERMGSLGNSLTVLSQSKWVGADLLDLLNGELAPYLDSGRAKVILDGPKVMIPAGGTQPVSMALHELVTNAVKYGALSFAEGRLDISWEVRGDGILDINWRETIRQQPAPGRASGSGFGTRLLELTIEKQLGGKVTRQFHDGRFECRLEIPMTIHG